MEDIVFASHEGHPCHGLKEEGVVLVGKLSKGVNFKLNFKGFVGISQKKSIAAKECMRACRLHSGNWAAECWRKEVGVMKAPRNRRWFGIEFVYVCWGRDVYSPKGRCLPLMLRHLN